MGRLSDLSQRLSLLVDRRHDTLDQRLWKSGSAVSVQATASTSAPRSAYPSGHQSLLGDESAAYTGAVEDLDLPALFGQPFLRGYLLAEHGRCPCVANMLENSRTTFTTRLVCFLAWNMPYHAEHHRYPVVPYYRLPDLHADLRAELKSTANGYGAFTADYARNLEH